MPQELETEISTMHQIVKNIEKINTIYKIYESSFSGKVTLFKRTQVRDQIRLSRAAQDPRLHLDVPLVHNFKLSRHTVLIGQRRERLHLSQDSQHS